MRRGIFFLVCILSLVSLGCGSRLSSNDVGPTASQKLERGQLIYITVPKDAGSGQGEQENSGIKTATALSGQLQPYASSVVIGSQFTDTVAALAAARESKARYVFVPALTGWAHRLTIIPGRTSEAGLRVAVYDLAHEDQKLMEKDLRVRGRPVNMIPISQQPEDMIRPLLEKFVIEIF